MSNRKQKSKVTVELNKEMCNALASDLQNATPSPVSSQKEADPNPDYEKNIFKNTAEMAVSILPIIALVMCERYNKFVLANFTSQAILFAYVAMIPGYFTGKLSYVDIAWPWGLALIGGLILWMGTGTAWRVTLIGAIFLFIGGRMGMGALDFLYRGVFSRGDLPRYEYRKLMWKKEGIVDTRVEL